MHPWDIGKREHYLPITNLNMIKNHHRLFDEARTTIDNNNNSGGSSNSSNINSWMWKVQRLFNAISAWPYPNVYTHTHTSHCDDVLYWVLSVNPIPFNPYLSAIFTCRVLCVLESREREGERLLLLQLAICLCCRWCFLHLRFELSPMRQKRLLVTISTVCLRNDVTRVGQR